MTEKEKIILKAESLFMRLGIKSVSMDDISRELGISKKTLYQFVETKKDLIHEIVVARLQREVEMIDEAYKKSDNAIEEILGIARAITKDLRGISPNVLYELQKYYGEVYKLVESFHNEFIYKTILNNLQRGIKEKNYRADIKAEIIAKLYVAKNIMLVDEVTFSLMDYNPDELFREHITYHIHGVASGKGIKLLDQLSKSNEN